MCGLAPSKTIRPASSWLKPEQQEGLQRVPALRDALCDRLLDPARHRVGVALAVLLLVAEERRDIPHGGEADAEHLGILHLVGHLIEELGIEPVLQAQHPGVRGSREGRLGAIRVSPVAGRDLLDGADLPGPGLRGLGDQAGLRGVERCRIVGDRIGQDRERPRFGVGLRVGEARQDDTRDRRSVGVLRDRNLYRDVGIGGSQISLPAADEMNVAVGPGLDDAFLRAQRPSPIDEIVPEKAGRLRHVDRLRQLEHGHVLDLAVRIAGSELQVDDDGRSPDPADRARRRRGPSAFPSG